MKILLLLCSTLINSNVIASTWWADPNPLLVCDKQKMEEFIKVCVSGSLQQATKANCDMFGKHLYCKRVSEND